MNAATGMSLLLCSVAFWIPAAAGLYLYVNMPHDLGRMAGLLTLKPILTTPIWLAIVSANLPNPGTNLQPAHFASILPGVVVTVMIVTMYWRVFSGPNAGAAVVLLVLDTMRWLNSFLMLLPYNGVETLRCLFGLVGLAMPSVFAVVALTLTASVTLIEK